MEDSELVDRSWPMASGLIFFLWPSKNRLGPPAQSLSLRRLFCLNTASS